jgi:hypothetical protein
VKPVVQSPNGCAAQILSDTAFLKSIKDQYDARISTGFFHYLHETLLTGVSSQNGQNEHAYGISTQILLKYHKRAHPADSAWDVSNIIV